MASDPIDALKVAFAHSAAVGLVADRDGAIVARFGAEADGAAILSQREGVVRQVIASKKPDGFEASVGAVVLQVDVSAIDDDRALLIGTDVTARKRTEERLRRSEAMMVDTQGVAHLGTWEWDVTEPTATWSDELYRIYDVTPETYTPSYEAYLTKVHPDDREHVKLATERAFRDHVPYSHDERILRPDGSIRYLHTWAYPVLDDAGKLVKLVGVCQDITDRKLAETAVADHERRLQESYKLEAIGRLAGGIAHDFNNLLALIVTRSSLVQRRLREDDPARESLHEISTVAKRASGLTQQLLAFSREQPMVRERVDMRRVIGDLSDIFGRALGSHVELVTRLDDAAAWVEGDRSQLDQVVMNLVINARDAMPDGGTITIELLDDAPSFVTMRVRDSGIGMDDAVKARIFDPYFTTKKEGNGLGLSTTYGIVKTSGGDIRVESAPGRGACFTVQLPRASAPEQAAPIARSERAIILLVEDQTALRHLIRMQLGDLGYDVIEADGPEHALTLARDQHFDLLLTDVIMPQMNGVELARKVRALREGARVLFVSGWADDATMADGEARLLAKPFTSADLSRAVESALR